ncbi:hypothetical protein CABS01_00317 [Colletotrichum abscissum]|uniref:Isochorismatase-like domain-containing protein n=1 Tax=Colletotrichum abscissum TaxID=1671311 RepID=A0A9P9XA04_9PEZI|nr:uncharacterized protein CABS01_00317 [Colletotrichum abscissum]KAI3544193.1 hypothetical protein CABS02_09867 [Colletotrichum abscissum]KAK1525228.1 hypothetical protein CABS01_00317 [Colletotrichum abscissum]
MATPSTAIVLVDPYNEFLHHEGKIYPSVKESLEATGTNDNLRTLVAAARKQKMPIFYALHKTWKEGNYAGWTHLTPSHKGLAAAKGIAEGSWGAEILEGLEPDVVRNGDVVASRHWNNSGFHVTLLSDATAGFSTEAKDAATNLIWPLIVENVTTVRDWVLESESKA